jgi:hypothetical protein
MISVRRALAAGFGLLSTALVWAQPASAQYYGGGYERDRGYERRDRYDRGDNYGRDRGYDRGGYDRGRDYGRGDGYGRAPRGSNANPLAGMSIEDQKRAIKNHRQLQKKAFKQGVIIP